MREGLDEAAGESRNKARDLVASGKLEGGDSLVATELVRKRVSS